MTERVGRHARWSVAALLAPASAALFAGWINWTTAHPPQPAVKQAATYQAGPSASAADAEKSELDQQVRDVARLRAQVRSLREQLAHVREDQTSDAEPVTSGSSSGLGSSSGSGASSGSGSSSGSSSQPTQAPKPTPARTTRTAPPVAATTGAS
jgi:hypothetical protein